MNKNKEQYYIKEIKDNEIEKKILQDQIYEKDCDIEAYKETIKSYENTIKKLNDEKKNLLDLVNSRNINDIYESNNFKKSNFVNKKNHYKK